jgi:protein-S-isoprenylcysteine O-methyltransferase Ste14
MSHYYGVYSVDEELLFRITFLMLYGVFAGIRIYYRRQNLGREAEREDTKMDGSVLLLIIGILGYLLSIVLYILLPEWIWFAFIPLPSLVRWLGVGAMIVSLPLLWWIHHTLGQQYSAKLEIQQDHQLVTSGPYSRVRNPMYSTFILFSIGTAIVGSNLLLFLFTFLMAMGFPFVVKKEEELLISRFGDEYLDYLKRTGRFLPTLRGKSEEE